MTEGRREGREGWNVFERNRSFTMLSRRRRKRRRSREGKRLKEGSYMEAELLTRGGGY